MRSAAIQPLGAVGTGVADLQLEQRVRAQVPGQVGVGRALARGREGCLRAAGGIGEFEHDVAAPARLVRLRRAGVRRVRVGAAGAAGGVGRGCVAWGRVSEGWTGSGVRGRATGLGGRKEGFRALRLRRVSLLLAMPAVTARLGR